MPDVKIPPKNPPAGGPNLDWTVVSVKSEKPDLREKEKPLVDLKVTNPITYIKSWWKKIIGNDGIELKIKVKPLTAIAIAIIATTVTLGIGKFKLPLGLPFFEYSDSSVVETSVFEQKATPTPVVRETAFSGNLKYDSLKNKYYLLTANVEAITLAVPDNLDLLSFVGRRIFAAGNYNETTRILIVESASDTEILPTKAVIIPTETPTPAPGD